MRISDWSSDVCSSDLNQDLPGSLTLEQALTTPKLSRPDSITKDQERDIDSIRLQNRTAVDLGNGTLAFGAFYNSKQLFHPIYEVIDKKYGDGGIFASLDLAGEVAGLPGELTLGRQARFRTRAALQYVNVSGSHGALTSPSHPTAATITQ